MPRLFIDTLFFFFRFFSFAEFGFNACAFLFGYFKGREAPCVWNGRRGGGGFFWRERTAIFFDSTDIDENGCREVKSIYDDGLQEAFELFAGETRGGTLEFRFRNGGEEFRCCQENGIAGANFSTRHVREGFHRVALSFFGKSIAYDRKPVIAKEKDA